MPSLESCLKYLKNAANDLRKARIEQKSDLSFEIRLNFLRIKQFIEIMDKANISGGQGAQKFNFIINNVHRNLKFIPSNFKAKVQDNNVCSVFYDLNNLYEFSKVHNFPAELDVNLSRELISLLKGLIDLFIDSSNNLKPLADVTKKVMMFDRETKHFYYFSYYNDVKHLSKAIEMIDFLKIIDLTQMSGKIQFISGLGQAFEHLSVRMLSQRLIDYISSDISKEYPIRIRNFIVHREKDLDDKLNKGLAENRYTFESMRNELVRIGASLTEALVHLQLAVKPRIILGNVIQDLNQFKINTQAVTVDSINNFYEKIVSSTGAKYKYSKVPLSLSELSKTIGSFDVSFPSLVCLNSETKEEIVAAIALGNKDVFNAKIDEVLKIEEFKLIRRDVASLKSGRSIQMEELQKLIQPENPLQIGSRQQILFITKKIQFYKNKMLEVINKVNSVTDHINGKDLYKLNIDFNLYRVTTIPAYRITNVGAEYVAKSLLAKSAASQRYSSDFDFYKIKLLYEPDAYDQLQAHEIGIGRTEEMRLVYQTWGGGDFLSTNFPNYYRLLERVAKNSFKNYFRMGIDRETFTEEDIINLKSYIIPKHKLQMTLIPLTDKEHSDVYRENYQPHEVDFFRSRVLDENQIERINQIFSQEDMTTRINNYLAFLEISENLLHQKELLLEAEFYLSCIEGYNSLIEESTLNTRENGLLRDFRNYLVHDRELGDQTISHSHEQITLRYILEFTRLTEQKIIPVLHDVLAQGIRVAGDNNIISLNVQEIKYDNPEEVQKIIEAAKQKVQDHPKDKNTLDKAIENIGDVLGIKFLMANNFYNFVPKFSFNRINDFKEKVIMIMANLANEAQELLDLNEYFEYLPDFEGQIQAIYEQLEVLTIYSGSSTLPVPHSRYPGFPSDHPDFSGGSGRSYGNNDNATANGDNLEIVTMISYYDNYTYYSI